MTRTASHMESRTFTRGENHGLPPVLRSTLEANGETDEGCCMLCSAGGVCTLQIAQPGIAPRPGSRMAVPFARGAYLYRAGGSMRGVFFIRTGAIKTVMPLPSGGERVTGLHLPGDVVGLEAVGESIHGQHAIAVEKSSACAIDFEAAMTTSRSSRLPLAQFARLVSNQLREQQTLLAVLSGTTVDQRLAAFLLRLSVRLSAHGQPPRVIDVRLNREELGSYLSSTLETVSRAFSRLRAIGAIEVRDRQITVLDRTALERTACPPGG